MPWPLVRIAVISTCLIFVVWRERAASSEPADPRRPAAIKTEGVPSVPAEIVERLAQYGNVRAAAFSGWSPDGKGILISTRFGNSTQLHRVYEPGGRREQITFFEEPVSGSFIPKAQDGAILLVMGRGGNENFQAYLLDRAAYRVVLLTDGNSRNLIGAVQHDGTQMIVASNRRNGRDMDLYLADCRRPDSMSLLLEAKGQSWNASDFSPDGKHLALARYVSINETYPHVMELESKRLEPLPLVSEGPAAYGDLAFSPDGNSLYLTCDALGEFSILGRFDRASQKYEWLTTDIPWDVGSLVVDEVTGRVAFTVNEDGASRLYLLAEGRRQALDVPLGIIGGLEFSPDGQHLGFSLARPDAPADAYSLSLANGELTRWTYSETGGLNPSTFITPQRLEFVSFDGRRIPFYYFKPRTANPQNKAAVLINIHGGPESQYRPFFSGVTQYYLNELGLAVIHPNVRGSAGYGKTYLTLDNAEKRADAVKDIGSLLDWIARQPELDPQRVAVTGGSYGGFMVLASLVSYGERIKAGMDHVGVANFITLLERTSAYRQDLRRAEYGDERDPKMRAVFERISPALHADKIRSALLVSHGRNDPRVPFSEAQQVVAGVRLAGQPVWTVYADNEGHGFSKKDNRDYLTAVEVIFLAEHLKLDVRKP
jgi:dipeptidyl aminopeptidase/acylaminoacyl peptidase